MEEKHAKLVSILIKTAIVIAFSIIAIILLWQYIQIAKLNATNDKLNAELSSATQQSSSLNNQKNEITNNYEEYVADYVRDKYNYTEKDEIIINKN